VDAPDRVGDRAGIAQIDSQSHAPPSGLADGGAHPLYRRFVYVKTSNRAAFGCQRPGDGLSQPTSGTRHQ
jgi:hypothetical protein